MDVPLKYSLLYWKYHISNNSHFLWSIRKMNYKTVLVLTFCFLKLFLIQVISGEEMLSSNIMSIPDDNCAITM